jgi:hypothetical protein
VHQRRLPLLAGPPSPDLDELLELRDALDRLSERQRSALVLRFFVELVDALSNEEPSIGDRGANSLGRPASADRSKATRSRTILAAAVVLVLIAVGALVLASRDEDQARNQQVSAAGDRQTEVAVAQPPVDFGSWSVIAEAPLAIRSRPVTFWTGFEAVFWSVGTPDRMSVVVDGAAYSPAADAWNDLPVPGWGHPGLAAVFDGENLYVMAKGSLVRFDPDNGE